MNLKIGSNDSEELITLLKQAKSLQHMLDIAYEILGNPIAIFDIAYNLFAYTEIKVSDDPLWNELISLRTFSHETVEFFNQEQFIEAFDKSDVVALLRSNKLKYDRANGKLFGPDGIQVANMVVVACHKPFEEIDFVRMETTCECLSEALQKSEFYSKIGRVFEETFITDLIMRQDIDKEMFADEIKYFSMKLKSNLYVAVVDLIQSEHTLTHLVYFRDLFSRLQREYKYFIYLNNIIIILNIDKPTISIQTDLGILHEFFLKYNIFAGLSCSFQNLFELKKYYRQALNALNYGMNHAGGQRIFKYEDFMIEHFLNCHKDAIDMWDFFSPVVSLIQEYDEEHGTVYLETIQAYLLTGLDKEKTATMMKIDCTMLCERLQHLSDLFELDWNNGNLLLNIFISIKMLECLSR